MIVREFLDVIGQPAKSDDSNVVLDMSIDAVKFHDINGGPMILPILADIDDLHCIEEEDIPDWMPRHDFRVVEGVDNDKPVVYTVGQLLRMKRIDDDYKERMIKMQESNL